MDNHGITDKIREILTVLSGSKENTPVKGSLSVEQRYIIGKKLRTIHSVKTKALKALKTKALGLSRRLFISRATTRSR